MTNPDNPANSEADPRPKASIKVTPQDFVVEEVPAYEPSGKGDHLYVTFRKTGLTTDDAVRRIADALGASARDAGVAGMKDKVAVTTQTASFLVPPSVEAETLLRGTESDALEILSVSRHGNKLKPGHLTMNKFAVRLRGLDGDEDRAQIARGLERARAEGIPNFYGSQRFGTDAANAERARVFLRGERPPPRDKRQVRFLFSAFQSELFNRVLERRVEDGSWSDILPGDLAKKHDTGGLFEVPLEGPELEDARARAHALAVSATGPMFGASMRAPTARPGEIEAAVLATSGVETAALERFRHAGEGTRRALRLIAMELGWTDEPGALMVTFGLTKGGYATTVLGHVCRLEEPPRRRTDASNEPDHSRGSTSPTEDGTETAREIEGCSTTE